jgi:hypothetical protein
LKILPDFPFGFPFFGLSNKNFFLQSKVVNLAPDPPTRRTGLCIYVPPWYGGPVITTGTGFLFVTFYDSQGYGVGILNRLHTR